MNDEERESVVETEASAEDTDEDPICVSGGDFGRF
jgi:hypothetical protein